MSRDIQNLDHFRNYGLSEQRSNLLLPFASMTIFLSVPRPLNVFGNAASSSTRGVV
jgi:hypothetical protein